ncbi:MAG: acetyl-CoA carboxylase biotin carboxylase subunit [Bacteroidales bacterium]|nr:acetyl-CoA carboxylase biotin carboxylase subunit [Bacteroidales bacterium]
MGKKITKILIANRGEIAVRVMRTAKKLGIRTVGIYSRIDAGSLHVTLADEAVCIGEAELSETYLNIPTIIATAKEKNCDAIHPGYGFLAESAAFVKACDDAGLIFIGPDAKSMQVMGNKIEARSWAKNSGVPITEGVTGDKETLIKACNAIGFPVLLKAAAGGGGKGMTIVREAGQLEEALEATARQAKAYFGDDTVYIEKYLEEPRHIEIQILGDLHGNVIHLFERECSIQRRYQKIIEESPSPTLTAEVRAKMGTAAVKIGKEIGYSSAGTIEFLVDKNLNFYFLEMNTRIQVEHPVTEMVTGVDIVEEQIRIAEGEPLRLRQEDIHQHGHAIECRIYAEDPENNFLPSPGLMTLYSEPQGDQIRIDTGVTPGTEIKSMFDPMISKLVVWADTREQAARRMNEALAFYGIHGIRTNISYLKKLIIGEPFLRNTISTRFCDEHTDEIVAAIKAEREEIPRHLLLIGYLLLTLRHPPAIGVIHDQPGAIWRSVGFWRHRIQLTVSCEGKEFPLFIPAISEKELDLETEGKLYHAAVHDIQPSFLQFTVDGEPYHMLYSEDRDHREYISMGGHIFLMKRLDFLPNELIAASAESLGADLFHVNAPMPGKVIKINVKPGDDVKKGTTLLILEAMKMENNIVAFRDARVSEVNVELNQLVEVHSPLVVFEEENSEIAK